MKFCTKCGAQCQDTDNCCASCGAPFNAAPAVAAPVIAANDHTADFTAEEISEGKLISMIVYLFGFMGLFLAALLKKDNSYIEFNVRAALKICVIEALAVFVNIIPVLGQIVYVVATVILLVIRIIAFFNICGGKAKDPAIIGGFGFFK